jgi:hypothetical protein
MAQAQTYYTQSWQAAKERCADVDGGGRGQAMCPTPREHRTVVDALWLT